MPSVVPGQAEGRGSAHEIEEIINLFTLSDEICDHACDIKPVYTRVCALNYI